MRGVPRIWLVEDGRLKGRSKSCAFSIYRIWVERLSYFSSHAMTSASNHLSPVVWIAVIAPLNRLAQHHRIVQL